MHVTACRACGAGLRTPMVDLGVMPLANNYLSASDLASPEPVYPLRVVVCDRCLLAQLDETADATAIFSDYAYFSSYSETWLDHARRYVDEVATRFGLGPESQVVEIASNDGYLLRNFVARGIPALGIEPAANVAEVAVAAGVPTRVMFFNAASSRQLVAEGTRADLLIGNNVLAHVPELADFVRGVALMLKPHGVATFEFPHLLRLIAECQFDTIYHEHFSYFSLLAVERVLETAGLAVFDVQEVPTHGGSLRLFVQLVGGPHTRTSSVDALRARELAAGLALPATYAAFGRGVERLRAELVSFLRGAKQAGKRVAAYGAPAKGNTLLNYCGLTTDLVALTVDCSPHKQGRYLPGSHIPVHDPAVLREVKPDYLLLLPWNLRDEIMSQMSWIREWGGQFVIPIPTVMTCR